MSRIEIPLPTGPLSNNPIYGPLNYTINNMKLSLIDPGIGLSNITWYRVLNELPGTFPDQLRSSLAFHLKSASIRSEIKGEILIIIGTSECGSVPKSVASHHEEIRLVTLTDGNLYHLIADQLLIEEPNCCYSVLDGHYGIRSCINQKYFTVYLVTHGSTEHVDWESYAESSFDVSLNLRGLHQAEKIVQNFNKIEKPELVISSTDDASVITGEIIANSLGIKLWISKILSIRCGLQYEIWRLLKRKPLLIHSKSIIDLLTELSFDFHRIILVMDPCTAESFVKPIGYNDVINPNSILKIEIRNLSKIPYWEFILINPGLIYLVKECSFKCEIPFTVDLSLLEGSEIDYTISQNDLLKFTPIEQKKYIRLQYERDIWTNVYWEQRDLFRESLIHEKNGVRYWGEFSVSTIISNEPIGVYWSKIVKNIWRNKK
jgi:hypothetical protein